MLVGPSLSLVVVPLDHEWQGTWVSRMLICNVIEHDLVTTNWIRESVVMPPYCVGPGGKCRAVEHATGCLRCAADCRVPILPGG